MKGSQRLAVTLFGATLMLSAFTSGGQQSSPVADPTKQEVSATLGSIIQRAPADMPPNLPKVTCEGGNLTISAVNSTLGAVLNAIRSCTGAEIDVPEGARGERLFADLGPGPVRAVLADFLSSMDFNYVIKASPSDPQRVQMVLLSLRTSDSTKEVAPEVASNDSMSANRRAWMEARHNYEQSVSPPDVESTPPADTASSTPPAAEIPAAPPNSPPAGAEPANPALAAPAIAPTPESEASSAATGSSNTPSQGKSTPEMISDMQRMFEQRKQMIQQQQQQTSAPPH